MLHERYETFLQFQPEIVLQKIEVEPTVSAPPPKKRASKRKLVDLKADESFEIPPEHEKLEPVSKEERLDESHDEIEISVTIIKNENFEYEEEFLEEHVDYEEDEESKLNNSNLQKWNTNEILKEEQRKWILKTAQNSRVREGVEMRWKCSICSRTLKSQPVLRKHLRDVHIITPTRKLNEPDRGFKRGKNFMVEVRSCRMTMELPDGQKEDCWQCKRCDTKLTSESGYIKHLLYVHLNNTPVDPAVVASCKVEIEYENGKTDSGWSCSECNQFYRTAIGLKNHLRTDHSSTDFGSENYHTMQKEKTHRLTLLKHTKQQSELMLDTETGPFKIYRCFKCNNSRFFKSYAGFRKHMMDHMLHGKIDEDKIDSCQVTSDDPKKNVWKCPLCPASVKTKNGFISHVTLTHPGQFGDTDLDINLVLPEENSIATDDTLIPEQFIIDRSGKLMTGSYKLSCNECGLFFRRHFPTHVEAHKTFSQLTEHYVMPKCEECRIMYANEDAMMTHLMWHAGGESQALEPIPSSGLSEYGGKKFKDPAGTAEHAVEEKVWKCGHCFATFWNENECVQHQMMLHMDTLTCPVDRLEFRGNRGIAVYTRHMKNKHPELFPGITFPCTYCKTDFSTIFDKLAHMKLCRAKQFQCDGCGKSFFTKIQLAHHLRVEKGLLTYNCKYCQKKCQNSMDLKIHIISIHTDDRFFACTYEGCEKTFKTSASRSSHMEIHGLATLKCPHCPSAFKKRIILARHIKSLHSNVKA